MNANFLYLKRTHDFKKDVDKICIESKLFWFFLSRIRFGLAEPHSASRLVTNVEECHGELWILISGQNVLA